MKRAAAGLLLACAAALFPHCASGQYPERALRLVVPQAPIFVDRFAQIGDEPAGGTPQDFAETIKKDSARWGEVVRRSGAKID